jgi:hypothetical protein
MKKILFIVCALMLVFGLSAMSQPTNASNAQAEIYHWPFGGSPQSCQGYGAEGGDPDGGFINAHINLQRETLTFNVHVRGGLPNTTYDVFVRCLAHLGTLTTNSHGVGNATFKISTASIPAIFAIDMHSQPLTLDYATTGPIELP